MAHSLSSSVHSELLIKKSRFIGCVQSVADRATAQQIVNALRVAHPGAAHVCWALMAGGHSAAVDDGEPSGTAGRPMLEVLRHQQLEGVLATVVRYYGGIQLGAGGLVRAYTDCIAQALKQAEKTPLIKTQMLICQFPYALEGRIRREILAEGGVLTEIKHHEMVEIHFSLAADQVAGFSGRLADLSQGRLRWLKDS